MNLHNIASQYVAAINPWIMGEYRKSAGYTTNPDGSRTPLFSETFTVQIQMQALTYKDLTQISGLNLNGEKQAMYINGDISAIVRENNKGGDIIALPDGSNWLVAQVLENWYRTSEWTKVAVVRLAT